MKKDKLTERDRSILTNAVISQYPFYKLYGRMEDFCAHYLKNYNLPYDIELMFRGIKNNNWDTYDYHKTALIKKYKVNTDEYNYYDIKIASLLLKYFTHEDKPIMKNNKRVERFVLEPTCKHGAISAEFVDFPCKEKRGLWCHSISVEKLEKENEELKAKIKCIEEVLKSGNN